jgi:hypothetical protein
MPYTPEALAKRAKVAAIYGWVRQRIVLLIVALMLILQFLTWRATERIAANLPDPPDFRSRSPCHIQGTVSLDEYTLRQIRPK